MNPANKLGYLMQHVAAVMGRQADQLLQEQLGIGLSQFKILMVLHWNAHVQQRFIADSLGQTEASISRQIQLLQDKGLLTSRRNPANRRKRITTLTPRGVRLTEAAASLMASTFGPDYATMGEKQLQHLLLGLDALHAIVCQPGKTGACDHPSTPS